MILDSVNFRRADGSLVAIVGGLPYHVIEADNLHLDALAWIAENGEPPLEPEPEAPRQPALTRIFKADIWRRATDAEAAIIDAALVAQPVRMRRLWDDAQFLQTTDDLYPTLEASFVAAFGATRAAELLAATE